MSTKRKKITIYEYIENNNGNALLDLIKNVGADTSNISTPNQLIATAKNMVVKKGDEFIKELLLIHPDYKIFEAHFSEINAQFVDDAKKEVEKKYLNVDGAQNATTPINMPVKSFEMLMGISITIASIALVISVVNHYTK